MLAEMRRVGALLMIVPLQSPGLEQYAMRAFAEALDAVPIALAENSGLSPIETLAAIKSRQVKEKNTRLGVDCMQTGSNGELHPSPDSSLSFLRCVAFFVPSAFFMDTIFAIPKQQAVSTLFYRPMIFGAAVFS